MEMDSIYEPVPAEEDEVPTKKVRHRKKQFLKTIRKQMEFYFSDANLSKNRFLGQLVAKDPEVDLSLFLTFNKIRDLSADLDDIKKALKKSDMLTLTEDGTKIYRMTNVKPNEHADESTIYVEQLPPYADHEWLKSVFLPYGDVPYISIPKYPHNGLNKGFAFVEFDSPESATKALEAFGAMGCRLTAEIPPEQICSIKENLHSRRVREDVPDVDDNNFKVPGEENVDKESNVGSKKLCESERDVADEGSVMKSKPVKKRKITFDEGCKPGAESAYSDGGQLSEIKVKREPDEAAITESEQKLAGSEFETCVKKKRRKVEEGDGNVESEETSKIEAIWKLPESETRLSKKKRKKSHEERVILISNEQNPECETDSAKASKKCKKEVKEEVDDMVAQTNPEEGGTNTGTTKVSKKRKKEEKEESHEAEAQVAETEAIDSKEDKDDEKENDGDEEVGKKKKRRRNKKKTKKEKQEFEPKMSLRVLSKFEWKRLRNKYLDLQKAKMSQLKNHLRRSRWGTGSQDCQHPGNVSQQDYQHLGNNAQVDQQEEKTKSEKQQEHKFEFTPGVIIRLQFPEPPEDLKKFKTEAKAYPEVKYVDAMEGCNEAYVRCATAEAASQMVAQQTWSEMEILTGVAESAYWEKMNRDRQVQCARNTRSNVRGKTKLLAKVEKAAGKHIRFTAEEDGGPRG